MGQEDDQCGTQKAMERESGERNGWQQLMGGQWLGCYGMLGWEETLDKAVPMYLQIPADPSVMIIESRQPVLG